MKMLLLLAAATLLLTGCGPYKVTVYGKSGAAYTAPDLCAAELACQKAGETKCLHSGDKQTVLDPTTGKTITTVYSCYEVRPKQR